MYLFLHVIKCQCTLTTNSTPFCTGELKVAGDLSPDIPETTYTLTILFTDGCSSLTGSCVVELTVKNVPKVVL